MTIGQWILVLGGGGLGLAALWALWLARRRSTGEPMGASAATLTTFGLVGLLAGYHLLAYGLPPGAMPLRIPAGRLWIAAVAGAVAVGMSVALDRADRRAAAS